MADITQAQDLIAALPSGTNPFDKADIWICRLDQLSRSEEYQTLLKGTHWDIVIVDEAHKCSAHWVGAKTEKNKRFRLIEDVIGPNVRHLLLMTATPHNGDVDFQLFLSLLFFEEGWPKGAHEFCDAVETYAQFHWNHMRTEEKELLPLAERHLTANDWEVIASAFAGNTDPISDLREKDFAALFSRIVALAPAPVGLGEPWKKAAV